MDKNKIYDLASKDVYTGSIAMRDNDGGFIFSNGMRDILLDGDFKLLRSFVYELQSLETKKQDVLKTMLQLETPFNDDVKNTSGKLVEMETEIKEHSVKIEVLNEKIKDEKRRLLVRGELPNRDEEVIVKEKKKVRKNKNWKKYLVIGKKWLGGFLLVVIIEIFIIYSQIEGLKEFKSTGDIYFRVAGSFLIMGLFHLAEIRFKKHHYITYVSYLVFGMVFLLFMLFSPLVFNHFYGVTEAVSLSSWDLTNDIESSKPNNTTNSIVTLMMQYDYMLAIIVALVFAFINFIIKDEEKVIEENKDTPQKTKTENDTFNRLDYLKAEKLVQKNESLDLKKTYKDTKNNSSDTIQIIKSSLLISRLEIETIDKTIAELSNKISAMLSEINSQIKLYETDFKDVLKSEAKALFVTPSSPNIKDIKQFYNIVK